VTIVGERETEEEKGIHGGDAGEEGGALRGGDAMGRGEGLRVGGVQHRLGGARRVAAEGAVLGRGRRHQVLHHASQGHLLRAQRCSSHPIVNVFSC